MFGKLTWQAIPWEQPIPLVAGAVVVLVVLAVLAWVVLKGYLPYLWHEWITSVDHKRIGVMYTLLGALMLLRGFIDALMMRSQQAVAFRAAGYLPPEHYDQIFSAHGTIMIFFAAMPIVIGLMNFVVPLQLGVRDVAFPTLIRRACGSLRPARSWSTSRSSSANSPARAGWFTHRSQSFPTLPASASITTCGRC
jgi:cytochrome o ubiquinol oxidase subunit I